MQRLALLYRRAVAPARSLSSITRYRNSTASLGGIAPTTACVGLNTSGLLRRQFWQSRQDPAKKNDSKNDNEVYNAVVRVFTTNSSWNYSTPWQRHSLDTGSGSGFVIDGDERRIVTNAHCVADSIFVEVSKYQDKRKYACIVQSVNHQCDLALLKVLDDGFWDDKIVPLKLGSAPELQDEVRVVGYPTGGGGLSVTAGIVSRNEPQQYAHSGGLTMPCIQVDAAVNDGNSGGPALNAENMVTGVAFQSHLGAENTAYLVPPLVISRFLKAASQGTRRQHGYPTLGIDVQPMENAAMQRYFKMGDRSGVLITNVLPSGASHNVLKRFDVLLEAYGAPVSNEGTFELDDAMCDQVGVHLPMVGTQSGDPIPVKVLRDGEVLDFDIHATTCPELVPREHDCYDLPPQYCIFGGCVFTPLTIPYLQEWGKNWRSDAPQHLVIESSVGKFTRVPGRLEERIVLAQILPHSVNQGYPTEDDELDPDECILYKVQGEPVVSFEHFKQVLLETEEEMVSFELGEGTGGRRFLIVLDRKESIALAEPGGFLDNMGIKYDGLFNPVPPEMGDVGVLPIKPDRSSSDDNTYTSSDDSEGDNDDDGSSSGEEEEGYTSGDEEYVYEDSESEGDDDGYSSDEGRPPTKLSRRR